MIAQLDLFATQAPPIPLADPLDAFTDDELRAKIVEAVAEPAANDDDERPWWHPKALGFPLARSFADIFESCTSYESERPADVDLPDGSTLTPYCTIDGLAGFRAAWVRPRADVSAYIADHVIVPDVLYFKIVVRSDDQALVLVSHNRIIGSRWLALIDPRTIPPEVPPLSIKPDRSPKVKRSAPADMKEPTAMLTERQRDLLRIVICDGNVAKFGSEERIPDWKALKFVLETLGGKWKSKPQAFLFPDGADVAAIVETAIETGEILDPRAAGFFPTPRALAERLVWAVRIQPGDVGLEPNGGRGAIAGVVREWHPNAALVVHELLTDNCDALRADGFAPIQGDFLAVVPDETPLFDFVAMNPPFARGADVDHVTHALRFLRQGGRLAAIMSAGVEFRQDAKTTAFRALVERHGGTIERLPAGSFLESGTGVNTVMVTLTKGAT